jgi:hypothetical protein
MDLDVEVGIRAVVARAVDGWIYRSPVHMTSVGS